jgi:hypothetical protein
MGTSNFYNKNASRVFAVLMDYEQPIIDEDGNETDETGYISPDQWEYDDFISDIKSILNNCPMFFRADEGNNSHNLRSFEGRVLGSYIEDRTLLNVSLEVQITCILRSGYYEGANLDWEITYYIDGYEHDEIGNAVEEWEYQANKEFNQGLCKIHKSNAEASLTQLTDKLIEHVENIYTEASMPLKVVARFSNGETMYERA